MTAQKQQNPAKMNSGRAENQSTYFQPSQSPFFLDFLPFPLKKSLFQPMGGLSLESSPSFYWLPADEGKVW